jgi:hypothetical protein
MTRGLTTTVATAVQQENVLRALAVEMLLDSGALRVNSSLATLTIGGNDYLGVGSLGAVGTVSEESDLQTTTISLSLAGVPRDAVSLALSEPYQGRQVTLWEVVFDRDSCTVLADPFIVWRGVLDQMNIQLGDTATVEVTAVDELADMDRADFPKYTDEQQQRDYPGDLFFRYVPQVVEKDVIWPDKSFWDQFNSGGGGGKK